jgi:O-antigen ligase
MPAPREDERAENRPAADSKSRRILLRVGVPLALLLIFSTLTVFVQASWPLDCFQIGVYGLTGVYLLSGVRRGREPLARGAAPWLVYLIPVWGVIQILAHSTASSFETREAVLRWGALAAVFFLVQVIAGTHAARELVLLVFLCFSAAMAVLCLAQLFNSQGRVLWIFPTGYADVYGTFQYHNNYAQFIELSFPIAIWRALREGWRSWGYALIGGVLYSSVIGSASRAGAILCTAELLGMLLVGFYLRKRPKLALFDGATAAMLIIVPLLAALFTFVVGWQRVWDRFQQMDPYTGRREFALSALDMAKHRPLMGYGLDTFPEVNQAYAIRDFPFYANHAHNDWAEFAADGGVPFLLLVLIPFVAAIPAAIRHPWGMGLIAVMLHAGIDYPFPRPAVSGWLFAMLALIYMARTAEIRKERPAHSPEFERSGHVLEFRR